MPLDITSDDFNTTPSDQLAREAAALDVALEQAREQLDAMTKAASIADTASQGTADYSLHEVAGVGRYVISRYSGWRPLLKIIQDPAANVNFSLKDYPVFDKIIGEHFNSPYMLDPLDRRYESFLSLRDNISAVRNFLMETYYANSPQGMTPEKAKQALAEIAAFVGDGLNNNYLYFGVIPNHKSGPHIDIDRARAKGGDGAQYIYEKILEHQRHSNWMRPFAAVVALFGGKPAPDWMLPPASMTGFTTMIKRDLLPNAISHAPTSAEIEAALARVGMLEAERAELRGRTELNTMSVDLDAIGNHLLFTAEHIGDIPTLSEPVRQDAIEIAKDILRKLKISLGNLNIIDGLKLQPTEDLSTLGAIKGVAMVYERLLAWGRGLDPSIMQHPSILAATQAIGQLGYLAKLEALRMARAAGNVVQAKNLEAQLARIDGAYASATDATFGGLLDKVERGIDTVLNRAQVITVPGAKVGHSPSKELGSFMNSAPTAGMSKQLTAEAAGAGRANFGQQHAEALAAEQSANRARANHVEERQVMSRAQSQASTQSSAALPGRPGSIRSNTVQAARSQRSASTSSTATPLAAMTSTQLQQMQRNAANLSAMHHAEEQSEHVHHDDQQRQLALLNAQRQAAQKAAAKAASRIDPNMLKGFQNATSMAGINTAPVPTGRKPITAGMFDSRPQAPVVAKPAGTVAASEGVKPPVTPNTNTVEDKQLPPPPPSQPGGYRGRF